MIFDLHKQLKYVFNEHIDISKRIYIFPTQMTQFLFETLGRARTFQSPQWRYHSSAQLNPYQLASLGYSVTNSNLLQCVICHHTVVLSEEEEEVALPEILQNLKNHKQFCIYNDEKPVTITNQELYLRMDEIMAEIQNENKKYVNQAFPLLKSQQINLELAPNELTLKKILVTYGLERRQFKITFILNLFGWYLLNKESQKRSEIGCFFCGRKLPLQEFQTIEIDKQNCQRQNNTKEEKLFDPIGEHRYFCRWVNNLPKENGWKVYLQHLHDKSSEIISYKLKSQTLQNVKMRVQIDRYIENFNTRAIQTFGKIKHIVKECEGLGLKIIHDQQIGKDVEQEGEESLKRLRENETHMNLFVEEMNDTLKNSFKKIKLN